MCGTGKCKQQHQQARTHSHTYPRGGHMCRKVWSVGSTHDGGVPLTHKKERNQSRNPLITCGLALQSGTTPSILTELPVTLTLRPFPTPAARTA